MDTKPDRKWTDCQKCGKPMTMMVQATIVAPADLSHQFSKANLRRKDVYLMGVSWDGADYLCADHGLIIGGFGDRYRKMEQEVARAKAPLDTETLLKLIAEHTGNRISFSLGDLDMFMNLMRAAREAT